MENDCYRLIRVPKLKYNLEDSIKILTDSLQNRGLYGDDIKSKMMIHLILKSKDTIEVSWLERECILEVFSDALFE